MKKDKKKGFTLIEIIVVIGLLAVISGLFLMNMIKSQQAQKEEEKQDLISQIIAAANTYVAVNPEEVKNLYEGYGFVDIPIGDIRDAGLLSEELKDPETGKNISDEEKVRVKLDLGELLDIKFPIPDDEKGNKDAWMMVADPIVIPYDPNGNSCEEGRNCWCDTHSNVFAGLITDPLVDYTSVKSKMYLMNNKEDDPEQARMYTEDYFDKNGIDLRVQSCDVDPAKVGNYTITYVYKDPDLGSEKTVKRVVSVISEGEDVVSFTVKFLQSRNIVGTLVPIVQTFTDDRVNIKITEYYRGDTSYTYETTIADLKSKGYNVENFSTDEHGNFVATFKRIPQNSDGSLPKPYRAEYTVVPNKYKLTFDVDNGIQKARYNSNRGQVSPRDKIVTYEQSYEYGEGGWPTPVKTGYTFTGWYTTANGDTTVQKDQYMLELRDHTVYAHWTPNKYTTYYDLNGGDSVSSRTLIVTYDNYYDNLPTASKTGYTFLGWFTSPNGGTQITNNTVVQITSDTTYYAHWKANQYIVTTGSTSKTVTFDQPYGPLPNPGGYTSGYCHYEFTGWSLNGATVTADTIVKTPHDHALKAEYRQSYCDPPPPPSHSGGGSGWGSSGGGSSGGSSSGGGGCYSSVSAAEACMQQNAEDWWTASSSGKDDLHKENGNLADYINSQTGNGAHYDESGGWYDKGGNPITWK